MLSYLQKKRATLADWLAQKGLAHTLSLPVYLLYKQTLPLLEAYAQGPCLDAGAGHSPWKSALTAHNIMVISLDRENRGEGVNYIADIQDMAVIPTASMKTVLCTQVLEHIPRPWEAVAEMARVLAPGGYVIVSVPHLSVIHEAPHDYYRYTRYGLLALFSRADLTVERLQEVGGLVSFCTHPLSIVLLGLIGAFPGLRWFSWTLNYLVLIRCAEVLDRFLGLKTLYPCNYVIAARKEKT